MHIGKPYIQRLLTSQMYEWRCSGVPQLAWADDMVHCQTSKTLAFVLVNFYDTDLITGFLLTGVLISLPQEKNEKKTKTLELTTV